mgnify:CR=1 FL=1
MRLNGASPIRNPTASRLLAWAWPLPADDFTATLVAEGLEPGTDYYYRVEVEGDDLEDLVSAYACTIHKSQGSEYPAVVVILHHQHHIMLQRNLLYTAVTRGKRR